MESSYNFTYGALVSAELFRREKVPAPGNLLPIADGLKSRHAHLLGAKVVALAHGPAVPVADMLAALKRFADDLKRRRREKPPPAAAEAPRRQWSPQPDRHLNLLFPDKQKELVYKRLQGRHLTKTEREYYSRVVKKKLTAVADAQMQELAGLLVQRPDR